MHVNVSMLHADMKGQKFATIEYNVQQGFFARTLKVLLILDDFM